VQSALASVDGVEEVTVDFATKTAHVKTNGKVSHEQISKALEGSKFGCSDPQ
jgi:copper chaperone CopZ